MEETEWIRAAYAVSGADGDRMELLLKGKRHTGETAGRNQRYLHHKNPYTGRRFWCRRRIWNGPGRY